MKLNPKAVARSSSRHPWRTVGIWVVFLVTMGYLSATLLGDVLTQDIEFTDPPDSVRAANGLMEKCPGADHNENTVFFVIGSDTVTVDDPGFQERVTELESAIEALGVD